MRYFLKQCGFQELGSVGEDGKAKRGRYLMSSQNDAVVDFFPPLSIEIPNDTALLPIVPLYSRLKTYCSYVYHNSKYTGTKAKHPRNEYRIYLNSELENHQLYFTAEDIVIFRKSTVPSLSKDGEEQYVYYLDVVKDHYSGIYLQLSKIIENYPIRGGYGLYEGTLDFFEKKVSAFEASQMATDIHIDKSVTDRIQKSTDKNKESIFNPATFRDFVLAGYGNACAVTGQYAEGLLGTGVDVVYIKPKSVGGSCMPNNGIALSKDISLAFVQGKFSLSNDYEVIVHPKCHDSMLLPYHLKQIRVPPNSFFRPDRSNIEYHREYIFGSFLREEGN